MNSPALYRETQRGAFFNHTVFWKWIMNAIVHSALLFWLPMNAFTLGTVWGNGFNGDYLVLGNIVYTCVVLTVCLKAGLETNAWNWIIHLSIWGSIGLWFLFLIVYSYFWPISHSLAADMAGMIELIVTTPMFWLCMLLVPFVTLIPDITLNSIMITVCPNETDKVRLSEHGKVPVIDRIYKQKHIKKHSAFKGEEKEAIEMRTAV